MDFADSCLVYLAEKLNINIIATELFMPFENNKMSSQTSRKIILHP
ncbi:hypothetical protein GMMP15_1090003 [Candidatus Magnetomoraceae bacterium gMMP-15]